MDSTQKLLVVVDTASPLLELLKQDPLVGLVASAVEGYLGGIDGIKAVLADLPPDTYDGHLAMGIDVAARLISDEAGASIIAIPGSGGYVVTNIGIDPNTGELTGTVIGPVTTAAGSELLDGLLGRIPRSDLHHGDDLQRQIAAGTSDLPESGRPENGDRPAGL